MEISNCCNAPIEYEPICYDSDELCDEYGALDLPLDREICSKCKQSL